MAHRHHPILLKPIDPGQLRADLASIWVRGRRGPPPRIKPSIELSGTHRGNSRRYAETDGKTIFVAFEILSLPKAQRMGLLAHELGHVVLRNRPGHTEADADEAARRVFGVVVNYSKKWPGKGLQAGHKRPR